MNGALGVSPSYLPAESPQDEPAVTHPVSADTGGRGRRGDRNTAPALWTRHRRLAHILASQWRIPGYEAQDVEQEALIALWEASGCWRPDGGASFTSFAQMVIERRLKSALTQARRTKRGPLDEAVRVILDHEGQQQQAVDLLPHLHQVTDCAESREQLAAVLHAIEHELTPIERRAVVGIAAGYTYAEIGPFRQTTNAIERARKKLAAAA